VEFFPDQRPWTVPCQAAFPCATQNEIDLEDAKLMMKNGVRVVAEGANMPTMSEAIAAFIKGTVLFGPGKAANAGGVATSGLEMSQNAMRLNWTFDQVDQRLREIMRNIYLATAEAARRYHEAGNFEVGANIAGFLKVADAMLDQGVV
jgi:glutamate dehydrogenase (NADP+)